MGTGGWFDGLTDEFNGCFLSKDCSAGIAVTSIYTSALALVRSDCPAPHAVCELCVHGSHKPDFHNLRPQHMTGVNVPSTPKQAKVSSHAWRSHLQMYFSEKMVLGYLHTTVATLPHSLESNWLLHLQSKHTYSYVELCWLRRRGV